MTKHLTLSTTIRTAAVALAVSVGFGAALPSTASAARTRQAHHGHHAHSKTKANRNLVGGKIRNSHASYTVEQMLAATPLEMSVDPGSSPSAAKARPAAHLGRPQVVAPQAGRDLSSHLGGDEDACLFDPMQISCDSSTTPDPGAQNPFPNQPGLDPNTTPEPADPTPAPTPAPTPGQINRVTWGTDLNLVATRTEGRIFFTAQSDGKQHSCSGTVVASQNQSIVWTAGHCVHGGAGSDFHTDFIFVPAYDNGTAPYGQFTARERWTTTTWSTQGGSHGPFAEDFGALVLNPSDSGATVVQTVQGSQGIIFNQSANQNFVDLGYPADAPFDGSTLYACLGTPSEFEYAADGTPTELGLNCDMTGGASGGGWIINMDSQGLGYVNTVNSYGPADRSKLWGAYQGAVAQDLYNTVQAN